MLTYGYRPISACAGVRGVVSGVMGVMGVIDVVDGAGEMRPERNPFVKLARKDVGAEELPVSLEGDMIYEPLNTFGESGSIK